MCNNKVVVIIIVSTVECALWVCYPIKPFLNRFGSSSHPKPWKVKILKIIKVDKE